MDKKTFVFRVEVDVPQYVTIGETQEYLKKVLLRANRGLQSGNPISRKIAVSLVGSRVFRVRRDIRLNETASVLQMLSSWLKGQRTARGTTSDTKHDFFISACEYAAKRLKELKR